MAAALLSGQADMPREEFERAFPVLRMPLIALALEWEILDHRELRYILKDVKSAYDELGMLRRRYIELADAPCLCDAYRFPDRTVVNEMLCFNRGYKAHLEIRLPISGPYASGVCATIRETECLYHIWDCVRDARCDYYYVTVRRAALQRLRGMIGPEAYYGGDLPPHVPLWRFQEVP